MSPTVQKTFNVNRKEAAEVLNVSTRTLDRYISARRLSSKNIAGRILLNREELISFDKFKRKHKSIRKRRIRSRRVPIIQNAEEFNNVPVEQITSETKQEAEQHIYKNLYDELKEDLKLFQQRLEGANYRVGQLEAKLDNAVPMQEHQKLLTGHKQERFNKRILYILLAIILGAQPIWIILSYL